jgi:hypothetical protein
MMIGRTPAPSTHGPIHLTSSTQPVMAPVPRESPPWPAVVVGRNHAFDTGPTVDAGQLDRQARVFRSGQT